MAQQPRGLESRQTTIESERQNEKKEEDRGFRDPDLENWSANAKNQAEKFAKMSYSDFFNLLKDVVVESTIQGGTALIYAGSAVMIVASISLLITGVTYYETSSIVYGVVLGGLSILGFNFAHKKYNK